MRNSIILIVLLYNQQLIASDLSILITPATKGQCNGKIKLTITDFELYDVIWRDPNVIIKSETSSDGNDGKEVEVKITNSPNDFSKSKRNDIIYFNTNY